MKTSFMNPQEVEKKWWIVDASGKTLVGIVDLMKKGL